MSFFVIGDEDTVLGFKLVGVPGVVIAKSGEAHDAFRDAVANRSGKILLITERLAQEIHSDVLRQRISMKPPFVVEIPDRHGPLPMRKSIAEMIREAIGISI